MQLEEEGPNLVMYLGAFFYGCSCHFMSSNYLPTFVVRQIVTWTYMMMNMVNENDKWQGVVVNAMVILSLMVMIEGANYCSMRSKALLFHRIQVISKQE